jgi:two-component system response regulator FixJ
MPDRRVYVVDDDRIVRRSIQFMLCPSGFDVQSFESGEAFLKVADSLKGGCVLLDIHMGGMDGLSVLQVLRDRGIALPVIILSGHGDIGVVVRAMKTGAVDFIEKPFEMSLLITAIEQALMHNNGREQLSSLAEAARSQLNGLTPRERDVLSGLVDGQSNKIIAHALGISPRTVEIHRANLMSKLEVGSLSDALRIAFTARLGELAG